MGVFRTMAFLMMHREFRFDFNIINEDVIEALKHVSRKRKHEDHESKKAALDTRNKVENPDLAHNYAYRNKTAHASFAHSLKK